MGEEAQSAPTAAICLIGNELLSGKVTDANGPYLITELRRLGVSIKEMRIISDEVEAIAACINDLSPNHDYVFTSGGVGPTHDDITLDGIALAIGKDMVENATMAHHVNSVFAEDDERRAAFLKMAQVPEGTTLLQSSELLWPIYLVDNVYILPGVPEIFRRQFDAIKERFVSEPFFLRTIYFRIGEGTLAPTVTEACHTFAGVSIGSYPVLANSDYRVRITIESKKRGQVEDAARWLVGKFGGSAIYKVVDGPHPS
jgi:molybdenum cofactor synthesis domain-containing protein